MFSFIILPGSAILAVAAWMYWRWKNKHILQLSKALPGPVTLPVLGNALLFAGKSDFLRVLTWLMETYGEHLRVWVGPQFNVMVSNPHDIRLLLTSNKLNQKGPMYKIFEDVIGLGILSGGATWRNHRKLVTPSYNKKSVQHFGEVFNKEAEQLIRKLEQKDSGVTFDVYKDVVRTTTQCVCQTLMGLSKKESLQVRRLDEIVAVTPDIYDLFFSKITKWWYWPPLFQLLGYHSQQIKYKRAIRDMVEDMISMRREELARRRLNYEDLQEEEAFGIIDKYILCGELTEKELVEETFTLFTTSQEASAKIASGVLVFLAYLPDWQDKVYKEIMEVVGPEDRDVTDEDIKRLDSLEMVYKEALRYLPIAAVIQRTVQEDISLEQAPVTIPAGTPVVIPIHALHRNPKYWQEPDRVMPERFLPEEAKGRDPGVFLPFSLGPMDCLGRVYATSLIKTLVARVVRRVHFSAPPGGKLLSDLPLEIAISTRFAQGFNLSVRMRRQSASNVSSADAAPPLHDRSVKRFIS